MPLMTPRERVEAICDQLLDSLDELEPRIFTSPFQTHAMAVMAEDYNSVFAEVNAIITTAFSVAVRIEIDLGFRLKKIDGLTFKRQIKLYLDDSARDGSIDDPLSGEYAYSAVVADILSRVLDNPDEDAIRDAVEWHFDGLMDAIEVLPREAAVEALTTWWISVYGSVMYLNSVMLRDSDLRFYTSRKDREKRLRRIVKRKEYPDKVSSGEI